ncbi:uncharacterized protein LOC106091471 [Stomoxys calcitrans]|uniref:Uncharacterized protein n=1 Tax=Stomoxys calcitrans TaxID=35570 RepID=A0A1I8Q0K5_STOCA|nr:uncharacterized protein LOC106091471 [Stomoxys calcitrans]
MTPFDDFSYLINFVLLGEEPTIEDFILLVGTFVAFVAFILWCCFPIQPKDSNHRQFSCKTMHSIDNTAQQQIHTSYSKTSANSLIYNDYVLRNGSSNGGGGQHSYHCCT